MTWLREMRMQGGPDVVDGFRMRGREVTRLESFSDAVFGFALTLLVVSLEVPKSFDQLIGTMRGFPAFAVCFAMLGTLWNTHYKYCRRYGLDDGTARFLTCVLLFIVLLYIYPLKFLFTLSVNDMLFGPAAGGPKVTRDQISTLVMIYSIGFAAVYVAFALLYLHAWRLRDALGLSELEKLDTRFILYRLSAVVTIGLIVAAFAWMSWLPTWGGLIYFALFPILRGLRIVNRRRRAMLLAAESG